MHHSLRNLVRIDITCALIIVVDEFLFVQTSSAVFTVEDKQKP